MWRADRRPQHAINAHLLNHLSRKRQPLQPTMGVRGEIDKSGWHLIKPSRKESTDES